MDGRDGHLAAVPGTLLLVTAADCVPGYLLHPSTRTIALVAPAGTLPDGGVHLDWTVLLYTLARPSLQPEAARLGALPHDELERFAARIRAHHRVRAGGACLPIGARRTEELPQQLAALRLHHAAHHL